MMKNKIAAYLVAGIAAVLALGSCSSGVSYAELLRDERKATNKFLAHQRVENEIPADTIFETGPAAPYYRLDEDGNVYMQVVRAGSRDNRPAAQQKIYFRFTYYSLFEWEPGIDPEAEASPQATPATRRFSPPTSSMATTTSKPATSGATACRCRCSMWELTQR